MPAAAPAKMAAADALSKVPDVDIDPEGKFKYILVNIKVKGGTEQKVIVRELKLRSTTVSVHACKCNSVTVCICKPAS